MNKRLLEAVMREHGDTGTALSIYLVIARSTFSAKLNETNGAEFTQGEIAKIKARYSLNAEKVDLIFFSKDCV